MVRLAKSIILLLAISRVITGAQLASFQAGAGGWQLGTIAVGDIAGDAQMEIVVPYRDDDTGEWKLDAFDWRGNHLAGFPYNAAGSPINVSPTLYDIDGDGKMEIFFTAGPTIVALKGNGVDEKGDIVSDGGVSTITIADLRTGTYTFYCSVPGHEQAGMKGTLTVS